MKLVMAVRLRRDFSVFVCTTCDTPLESDCEPQALLWTPLGIFWGIGGGA